MRQNKFRKKTFGIRLGLRFFNSSESVLEYNKCKISVHDQIHQVRKLRV